MIDTTIKYTLWNYDGVIEYQDYDVPEDLDMNDEDDRDELRNRILEERRDDVEATLDRWGRLSLRCELDGDESDYEWPTE